MYPTLRLPNSAPFKLLALILLAATARAADVGSGAPNPDTTLQYVNAFFRNGFAYLVSLPPLGDVRQFGPTGYLQEFADTKKTSGVKLALIKPTLAQIQVYQVLADVYGYYGTVGVNNAGYPKGDTLSCPVFEGNFCTYQFFDKNYVLFAYSSPTPNGTGFAVRDPFYTRWQILLGVDGIGRPVDMERNVTSAAGTTAVQQLFSSGALFNTTSGPRMGILYAVAPSLYAAYSSYGGVGGVLGLPISDEFSLPNSHRHQNFEGGALDYLPGSDPVLLTPVTQVSVNPAGGPLRLKVGDTVQLTATTLNAQGNEITGRAVTWTTSNSRVATVQATIQATGAAATVKAVGQGSAAIQATSEGKTSPALTVIVSASCCQIGEGAPTAAIQQAFQDAVARNRLVILLPAQNAVARVGNGYVQELLPANQAVGVRYLVAKADRAPSAYVVAGDILVRYQALGGVSGSLGYPLSDLVSSAGGSHQLFENSAALGGSPARVVSGAVLAKWTNLGFESGLAGPPAGDAIAFMTSSGTAGVMQSFKGGAIFAAVSGARAGQAYLVSGLILDRYLALGGAGGVFGLPVSDEFALDGRRQQNFEGGYIDYAAGDTMAREHQSAQRPSIIANPSSVTAGSRIRISVTGFPATSAVKVSIAGQPDFLVPSGTGAYGWDIYIPLSARSGAVTIRAEDADSVNAAEASYTVKSLAESRLQLVKLAGDGQGALPGATLPQPLRVALRDERGNPVIGAPVMFRGSAGTQVSPLSAETDENGQAAASVRLPPGEAVSLVTADSSGVVATFDIRAKASSLANYPQFTQAIDAPLGNGVATIAQKGALLTAVASIVRYYQNQGALGAPNGLADPGLLNQFLKRFCVADAQGSQICDGYLSNPDVGDQVVNLWRAGAFTGGGPANGGMDVVVENPELPAIRDLLSLGSPVLLALSLTSNGAPLGGHYVVAVGETADAGILIFDPSANFARSNLNDYLNSFTTGARSFKAAVIGAVRLLPKPPSSTGFLIAAISRPADNPPASLDVASVVGPCGRALDLPDAAIFAADAASVLTRSRFFYCDGTQTAYQLSHGGEGPYRVSVTDLAPAGNSRVLSGSSAAAYKLTRPAAQLAIATQDVGFSSSSVVNAATFTPGIAPGGLFTIFGSGLAGPGAPTNVTVDGESGKLIAATPFQVNAQIPPELPPGSYTLRVESAFGAAEQTVEVQETAPVIFLVGTNRGAVVNPDGAINSATRPAPRGTTVVIYGTGFGAVSSRGTLSPARIPMTAVLNGAELPVAFAGLTPGFIGLYQANLLIPLTTPPGLNLPLSLRQGSSDSNTTYLAIR